MNYASKVGQMLLLAFLASLQFAEDEQQTKKELVQPPLSDKPYKA